MKTKTILFFLMIISGITPIATSGMEQPQVLQNNLSIQDLIDKNQIPLVEVNYLDLSK